MKKKNFKFLIRCRGRKRRNGMRGNIVPAWPSIFIVADMVLKKMKRLRWSPWKMIH